ncbi:MAG: hypothetical protein M1832_003064 [Thelocarpon impressellum]|nr:MAG: hypothetical protein M1832_003064 [Thelocarpon impressellum]
MAGLRIYGLQQKRSGRGKSISSGSLPELTLPTLPNQPTNPDRPGEADEYKLVYHQTFKGASFALRQHITITVLKQDDMRDVVDRLLAIFCADPLADSHSPAVIFNQDQSTNDSKSPFASSARAAGEVVSTPTVRRRHRDEEQRRPDESPLQHFKSRDVG